VRLGGSSAVTESLADRGKKRGIKSTEEDRQSFEIDDRIWKIPDTPSKGSPRKWCLALERNWYPGETLVRDLTPSYQSSLKTSSIQVGMVKKFPR
jgi:hypothetical protein